MWGMQRKKTKDKHRAATGTQDRRQILRKRQAFKEKGSLGRGAPRQVARRRSLLLFGLNHFYGDRLLQLTFKFDHIHLCCLASLGAYYRKLGKKAAEACARSVCTKSGASFTKK